MAKNFQYPKVAPYIPGDKDDEEEENSDTENETIGMYGHTVKSFNKNKRSSAMNESALLSQEVEKAEARFLPYELALIKKEFEKLHPYK